MTDLKKDDIVKVHLWHGVVVDIYRSETGTVIVEVLFVKNVFKMQRAEFIPLTELEPATLEGLLTEKHNLREGLGYNLERLLEAAKGKR